MPEQPLRQGWEDVAEANGEHLRLPVRAVAEQVGVPFFIVQPALSRVSKGAPKSAHESA